MRSQCTYWIYHACYCDSSTYSAFPLFFAYRVMNKEFLVDGKLAGKDVNTTRAPQRYGWTDLDKFMKDNHYVKA